LVAVVQVAQTKVKAQSEIVVTLVRSPYRLWAVQVQAIPQTLFRAVVAVVVQPQSQAPILVLQVALEPLLTLVARVGAVRLRLAQTIIRLSGEMVALATTFPFLLAVVQQLFQGEAEEAAKPRLGLGSPAGEMARPQEMQATPQ
jgi:hypothetical protein